MKHKMIGCLNLAGQPAGMVDFFTSLCYLSRIELRDDGRVLAAADSDISLFCRTIRNLNGAKNRLFVPSSSFSLCTS